MIKAANIISIENIKKVTTGIINEHAWVNDTWLAPYAGYDVKLIEYENGKKELLLDGITHENMQGEFFAPNGWHYEVDKLISSH